MSGPQTIHVWGHEDGTDDVKAAICDGSVATVARRTLTEIERHGHEVANMRSTRTLDGWLVVLRCVVAVKDSPARQWHVFTEPSQSWPTATDTGGEGR